MKCSYSAVYPRGLQLGCHRCLLLFRTNNEWSREGWRERKSKEILCFVRCANTISKVTCRIIFIISFEPTALKNYLIITEKYKANILKQS